MFERRPPRYVYAVGAIVAVGLSLLVAMFLWISIASDREDHRRCVAAIRNRDDNRSMWLYLIDQNPDNPQVPAFVVALDDRLPVLACKDNVPVPLVPVG